MGPFHDAIQTRHLSLQRAYMDYHHDRFADHSLMVFRHGKLYALLPANKEGRTLYSHQGLTYAGLLTTEKGSAEDICQLFVVLKEYLREHGFDRLIYKPIPWIYHQLPAEEDLYALFQTGNPQIIARNIAAVIDLKHPLNGTTSASRAPKKQRQQVSQ